MRGQVRGSRRQRTAAGILLLAVLVLSAGCASTGVTPAHYTEADIFLKRGDGYFFKEAYREAVAEYAKAIGADPRSADGYRSRGNALAALGDTRAALSDYATGLKLEPRRADLYRSRGILYYGSGNFAAALDDLNRAVDLDPWDATAHYYRAKACERVGRLREALESYERFVHCPASRESGLAVEKAKERIQELERSLQ